MDQRAELSKAIRTEVERQLRRERRRLRAVLWWALAVAVVVVPLGAGALPTRLQWSAGDPISAAEMNQNFEALWTAVEALEAEPPAPALAGGGFFDPFNLDDTDPPQITIGSSSTPTELLERSITVDGPGRVLVLGSAQLVDASGSGATLLLDVTGDGQRRGTSGSQITLPANSGGTLGVHGVFEVDAAGTYAYQVAAVGGGSTDARCRGAYLSLAFVPD